MKLYLTMKLQRNMKKLTSSRVMLALIVVLLVTLPTVSTNPRKASFVTSVSATERALLGCSYSEDCLFGSDYQVFGGSPNENSVEHVDKTLESHREATKVIQTSASNEIRPPAFIPKKHN